MRTPSHAHASAQSQRTELAGRYRPRGEEEVWSRPTPLEVRQASQPRETALLSRDSVLRRLEAARGSTVAVVAAGRQREGESEGEVAEVVAFSAQLLALRLCLF